MAPEAFRKAFGENSIPAGAVKYQLDHFAADGFPTDESDASDDGEFDEDDEDADDEFDDEDENDDDDEDAWDELDELGGDGADEEETADMEDIVTQRRKAGLCVANSLKLLRERLQVDGAGLALGLMLAQAEQDEKYRLVVQEWTKAT